MFAVGTRAFTRSQENVKSPVHSIEIRKLHPDGSYEAGVWLQVGAKFGLVALVGVLRFLVYRGGKHVLGTFVRQTTTAMLANH